MQRDVVVVSGVRTAIGDFGGSLEDIAPTELGAKVVREVLQRTGGRYAFVTMCIGGGQGIAAIFERI